MQIRRAGAGTVLIDPVNHGGDPVTTMAPVADVLSSDEWVLHAADQDLPCLAEIGMQPPKLYDTELAGRLAGYDRVNLAAMVQRLLGLQLMKGHGAADWSKRPLPTEWLNYAALDVEVLLELRDAIAAVLREQGKTDWAAQEFEYLRTDEATPTRRDRWRRTSGIHKVRNPRALAAVRELWTTRDHIARRRDIAPGRILPDSAIINAATVDPDTVEKLTALPIFGGTRQRRSAQVWLDALARARTTRATAGPGAVERSPACVALVPPQTRGGRAAGGRPRRSCRSVATGFGADGEPRLTRRGAPAVLGLAAGRRHRGGDRRLPARRGGPAVAARARRPGAGRRRSPDSRRADVKLPPNARAGRVCVCSRRLVRGPAVDVGQEVRQHASGASMCGQCPMSSVEHHDDPRFGMTSA